LRILFDQCTPAPFRNWFTDDEVSTAAEFGWSDLSNGKLISSAEEAGFELLITIDRNLRYQQNLTNRRIAIAVILESAWPLLKTRADEVAGRIRALKSGEYAEV
jgi:hypothetical protein